MTRSFRSELESRASVAPPSSANHAALATATLSALALSTASRSARATFAATLPDVRLLLERITYGHDPATLARAQAIGWNAFLDEQLSPETIADTAVEAWIAGLPTLTARPKQNFDTYYGTPQWHVPLSELRAAALYRAAFSKRQLLERMVELWTDHFNINGSDSLCAVLKPQDDREVIRAHALGKFSDLLIASARSAAMSFYLGNYRNTAFAPNENYGRELMELHTLGVGEFTETDVLEVARCLTGWGFRPTDDPAFGAFRFSPALHDNGAKVVLGTTIPAGGGVTDGFKVLRLLANHPKTGRFVARKLCNWFLGVAPEPLVDAVASIYVHTDGDLRAMVRHVLDHDTVAGLAGGLRVKLKRPFHLAASLLRPLQAGGALSVAHQSDLMSELDQMGHESFSWPTPDGYPDSDSSWGSGVLTRWTFLSRFCDGAVGGTTYDLATMFAGVPQSQFAARASTVITGGALPAVEVAAIQDYVDTAPAATDGLRRETLALVASAPGFQVY